MTPSKLCRNYIEIVDAVPSELPWLVLTVGEQVLLLDRREEATTVITEAIAGRFGVVVACESFPSRHADRGPLLGCLIDVEGNADDVAGKLRAAYLVATEPGDHAENGGPF